MQAKLAQERPMQMEFKWRVFLRLANTQLAQIECLQILYRRRTTDA